MTDTATPEPESNAAICRRNGGHGPSTIRITAVGERYILAVRTAPRRESEGTWTLSCRDWRKVEDDETATPEPDSGAEEPVTVLRGALDLGEINRLAAVSASSPEDRVGTIFRLATQTVPALTARIAELEADARTLGGDPDRMVDPRDHETAITAMRAEMTADEFGPHIISRMAVSRAMDIAERHMLRMAQASLGAAPEVRKAPERWHVACGCGGHGDHLACVADCPGCVHPVGVEITASTEAEADRLHGVPAGVPIGSARDAYAQGYRAAANEAFKNTVVTLTDKQVREVPAGEAREGDTVTDTRRGRIVRLPGDRNAMVRWDGNSGVQEVDLDWSRITVSRPVSPLPDRPGTFGLARVRGHGDIKHRLLLVRRNGALVWSGVDGTYEYGQVTDFEPLPARAGVDERGKR